MRERRANHAPALPPAIEFAHKPLMMARLDHVMWFHRDTRVDQWLLYTFDTPVSIGGRGFSRGGIFTHEGQLVASTTQEGVIRAWKPNA